MMLVIGELRPLRDAWKQEDIGAVDMTPWRHSRLAGWLLIVIVVTIYVAFADLDVLSG